jgi:hypothetical protein
MGEELSLLEKIELYLWLAKIGFLDLDLTDDNVFDSIMGAFTQGSGDNAWDPVEQMANPRKITDTWELVDEDGNVVVRWTRTTFYMCFGDPTTEIGKGWVPAEERLKTEIFDPTYKGGISEGRTIWTNSLSKGGDGSVEGWFFFELWASKAHSPSSTTLTAGTKISNTSKMGLAADIKLGKGTLASERGGEFNVGASHTMGTPGGDTMIILGVEGKTTAHGEVVTGPGGNHRKPGGLTIRARPVSGTLK